MASQASQIDAYRELTRSNKMREDDTLFSGIETYDGSNPAMFEYWLDDIDQASRITNRDLRKELIKKSGGVVRQTLNMMDDTWSEDDVIVKLCQDFSLLSTMNRARKKCVLSHRHQISP